MIGKPSSILAVAALSLLVVVAAGCGGKSKSAANTQAAGTTTATTAATTTSTTPAATTATQTSTSSGLSGIATAGNCSQLAGLSESFAKALSGNGTDIQKTAALLQEFANRTPSDIRADFQVVAAAYAKIANALKGVNLSAGTVPSASELQKLEKLGTEINQQALTKASSDISAWAQKNCTHA